MKKMLIFLGGAAIGSIVTVEIVSSQLANILSKPAVVEAVAKAYKMAVEKEEK